ncbi:MAG: ubiquinol-cytochrome c reductase iron-sulfur subunit [Chloroflexota bacterium]
MVTTAHPTDDVENGSSPWQPTAEVSLVGRRRLLKWLIGAASAAFAASLALPAVALKSLSVPKAGVQKGDVLVLANGLPGVPAGRPLMLADLPLGTGVQVFPQGKADNQTSLIEVVRIGDDPGSAGVVAFSAICTHLGCAVFAHLTPDNQIGCPCHGSRFDPRRAATVTGGPADRPLPSLPVTVAADGSIVADGEFSGPVGPR